MSNANGIFAAYSYEDNNHHTPDYWRLARSTDGGQTFHVIYDGAKDGSLMIPPAIETDAAGNVYVIAPTDQDGVLQGPTLFYRFSPANNYSSPTVYRLPIGGSGKFSTVYDPTRNVIDILFWAYGNLHPNFFSISPTGQVVREVNLFSRDVLQSPQPEYPILTIAPDGTVFAGWTTMDDRLWDDGLGTQNYYDAHFLASPDGGQTWVGPDGPVTPPVQSGLSGPAFEVVNTSDPTEFIPWHTPGYEGNWNLLQSMAYNKGGLSFFYGGPTPQPHEVYARMDWSTRTFVQRMSPFFGTTDGSITISDRGGSFSQDPSGDGTLYFAGLAFVGSTARLVVMYSDDGGSTWDQGAQSDDFTAQGINYISTSRYLDNSSVIGMFDAQAEPGDPTTVYFFRSTVVPASGTS